MLLLCFWNCIWLGGRGCKIPAVLREMDVGICSKDFSFKLFIAIFIFILQDLSNRFGFSKNFADFTLSKYFTQNVETDNEFHNILRHKILCTGSGLTFCLVRWNIHRSAEQGTLQFKPIFLYYASKERYVIQITVRSQNLRHTELKKKKICSVE